MSPDDVDSVFLKYHLIKAESARLIVMCKINRVRFVFWRMSLSKHA